MPRSCAIWLPGLVWLAWVSAMVGAPRDVFGEPGGPAVMMEAEAFQRLGRWVIDQQFMDRMGSPYLLAHGLGVPVEDAVTTVAIPAGATYRVWVRTRDWAAPWKDQAGRRPAPQRAEPPGRFQVVIGAETLGSTFGIEGAEWHWQDGGSVELASGTTSVALHDLTGFEGRCDAILLSADPDFTPPNADPEMGAMRRRLLGLPDEPDDGGKFDLVVAGGGIAGTCAAVAAARLDLTVAFIQDRPVLGGNNSSEVRVWLNGTTNVEPYPRVGDVVLELEQPRRAHYGPANTAELYEDEKKLAVVRGEKNIRLLLNHRANGVELDQGRIRAVIVQDIMTGRRVRLAGRWFVDATGDGCVGFLAGADHQMSVPGHMGQCNLWNVIDAGGPSPFPRCPWALDLSDKPFPGRDKEEPDILKLGGWYWESGFDRDPIADGEFVRDWNLLAMYGAWDAMKNVDEVLPNYRLNWAAYITGPRESRRLLGDVILTEKDLVTGRKYPDGCVATGWPIDVHQPDPRYEKGFEGDAFISKAYYTQYQRPYWVPYRTLYSRNVPNLFMAGRNVSVTHQALGAVRVMRTGGLMGEIVGMAASLCKRHEADPRVVYENYLDELKQLMSKGVGKEPRPSAGAAGPASGPAVPFSPPGPNLARTSRLTVSGSRNAEASSGLIVDGRADLTDNGARWLSDEQLPHTIELAWDREETIASARILSGYRTGGGLVGAIQTFVLQYHDGGDWRDVPGTSAAGNTECDWRATFAPVKTNKMRLMVTATPSNVSRIWEIELYGPRESRDAGTGRSKE